MGWIVILVLDKLNKNEWICMNEIVGTVLDEIVE